MSKNDTTTQDDLQRCGFNIQHLEAGSLLLHTDGVSIRIGAGPAWTIEVYGGSAAKPEADILIYDGETPEGAATVQIETACGNLEVI